MVGNAHCTKRLATSLGLAAAILTLAAPAGLWYGRTDLTIGLSVGFGAVLMAGLVAAFVLATA